MSVFRAGEGGGDGHDSVRSHAGTGQVSTDFAGHVVLQGQAGDGLTGLVVDGVGADLIIGSLGGFDDGLHIAQGVSQGGAGNGVDESGGIGFSGGSFELSDGLAGDISFDGIVVGSNLNSGTCTLHVHRVETVVGTLGTKHFAFGIVLTERTIGIRHTDSLDGLRRRDKLEFIDLGGKDHITLHNGGNNSKASLAVRSSVHLTDLDRGGSFFCEGRNGSEEHEAKDKCKYFFHGKKPPTKVIFTRCCISDG